jgi:hypothetical protein
MFSPCTEYSTILHQSECLTGYVTNHALYNNKIILPKSTGCKDSSPVN